MYSYNNNCKNITMTIFLFILLIILMILVSSVKFKIYFSQLGLEYYYKIDIYYFINICSLDKNDIKKMAKNEKIKKIYENKFKKEGENTKDIIKGFLKKPSKKAKRIISYINIEKLIINIKIGLIDILPTIFAIPILSTIISFLMKIILNNTDIRKYMNNTHCRRKNKRNYVFYITPIYNKAYMETKISCIIKIKIAHIIYIIFCFLMIEGGKKDGRTSNRRAYEYCNE